MQLSQIILGDKSHKNAEPYCGMTILGKLNCRLVQHLLNDSDTQELEWKKLEIISYRFGAEKIVDATGNQLPEQPE